MCSSLSTGFAITNSQETTLPQAVGTQRCFTSLLLHRRAATAVDGNATDAAAAAQHSRKLLAEAAADSTAGNPDRTSGRRSREGRRAQAGGGVRGGAGGRVAGDLRGAGATRRGRDPRLGFGVGAGARREARSRQRAAEQPLEERRAQQLAWEKCARLCRTKPSRVLPGGFLVFRAVMSVTNDRLSGPDAGQAHWIGTMAA